MASEFQAAQSESDSADAYAETVRVRVLPQSALQQGACGEPSERSFDPYNSDVGVVTIKPQARKTLDDMRRLSEAIVRNRRGSKETA
jgi:hypothetical protein